MEAYGGVKAQIYVFLNSALYRGALSASCPGRFMPGKKSLVPLEKVSLRVCLNAMAERNICYSSQKLTKISVFQPTAQLLH